VLLSRGLGGLPANGPSSLPAIDGSSRTAPTCVAFVSAASNLVPGDTNGQPDAFVAYLSSGQIRRVSVDARGRQADGPTTQVVVDGRCTRVAFVSSATNLALTATGRRAWKSARTSAPPAGTRQVYVRCIGGTSLQDRALRGLTFLASASNGARAGNADSLDPVFSSRGRSLGFTSLATNLGGGPAAGVAQVYQRALDRHFGPKLDGRTIQDLALTTRLVSEADGRPGNGSSSRPAITAAGDTFAYQTLATNLLGGDTHGVSQIVKTTLDGAARHHVWVSRRGTRLGDGPSTNATMSDGGEWVFYETAALDLRPPGDANRAAEVLLDAYPWVISADRAGRPLTTDSTRADASPHGNYVVFESGGVVLLRWLGPK
jgi:TolB protein